MFRLSIVSLLALATTVVAFHSTSMRKVSSPLAKSLKMSEAKNLVGSLAPVGFFDPLGLSNDKSLATVRKYREAELKHGRVAMLAFLGILIGESDFHPFFGGSISGPAIYQFQQADDQLSFFWEIVLFGIALVEGQSILKGWESPDSSFKRPNGVAELKPDYVNGDLGFDPLGLKPNSPREFDTIRTKELQNGRLAMLGVAGIVAQELVNGKGVLENLQG